MFRNFSTPQDVKKAVDNLYQTKLKEFRAAAYDTGYYAARLESNLSDTDRAEYTALQEASDQAYEAYFEALEAHDYNNLIQQREEILANASYEALLEEKDVLIAQYEIPTKLDLAKLAAKTLLGLSRLDSAAGRRISLVALVRFSTDYVLLQELTTNHDIVAQKIDVLESLELTNIYGGMDEALQELERNADPEQSTVIILLSDGHITAGPESDQVLKDVPPRADDLNATIVGNN